MQFRGSWRDAQNHLYGGPYGRRFYACFTRNVLITDATAAKHAAT